MDHFQQDTLYRPWITHTWCFGIPESSSFGGVFFYGMPCKQFASEMGVYIYICHVHVRNVRSTHLRWSRWPLHLDGDGSGGCLGGRLWSTRFSECGLGVLDDQMGVNPKIGGKPPKWMVKIMANPIKMDDLGVFPYFWKHPDLGPRGVWPESVMKGVNW